MMTQTHNMPHHPHDTAFIDSIVSHLPYDFSKPVAKQYASIYGTGKYNGERRRKANQYLFDLNENRKAGKTRILLPERDAIRLKADRLALEAAKIIRSRDYLSALRLLSNHELSEPTAETQEGKAARLACPDWWMRQLTKLSERETEHFAIKSGFVRRGVSAYVSTALLMHIQAKQKASMEALQRMEAVNTDTGETMDLATILKGSVANPEVRRVELMVRCRGFEEYADFQGHIAAFYTITAPSKYHPTTWNAATKKAQNNRKYSDVTPRETQAYLVKTWARIRSKLKRNDMNVYGFRVCEPHHDGTPHWHLLLFMNPEHEKAVTQIMRSYAMAEDGNEHGAAKHRFTVELIDSSKGSATGYIAKYISKNINGFKVDEDHESGDDASSSAERVRAWASLWGIRQFQMIGGAAVGVWRELRRVSQCPDGLLDEAMKAADAGDWMQYLILQGGAESNRKDQPIRCYSVERFSPETGEQLENKYGEPVEKVEGVSLVNGQSVITRVHEWIIQRKPENGAQDNIERLLGTPKPIAFDVDLQAAGARSSVNNCTEAFKSSEFSKCFGGISA